MIIRKLALSAAALLIAFVATAQNKMTVQEYIDNYKNIAVSEMHRTGIPASITLGQGLIETGNGNSRLAREGNNHFGIKCKKNWAGKTIIEDDDEKGECFRAYESAEESYKDHSKFLMENARYAFLFNLEPTDYKGWAKGLKDAGYATNPNYTKVLTDVIERHELHKLDHIKPGDKMEEKKDVPLPDPLTATTDEVFKFNSIKATKVQKGQTATSIAKAHHLLPRQLYKYNDLEQGSDLVPGTIVYLKPKKRKGSEPYHTVKEGETMYSISQLYGIKLKQLYKKNKLQKGMEPVAGEVLYMRKKRQAPPKTEGAEKEVPVKITPPAQTQISYPAEEKPKPEVKKEEPKKEEPKKEEPKPQAGQDNNPPKDKKDEPQGKPMEKPVAPKGDFVEKPSEQEYEVAIEEKNKKYDVEKKTLDNTLYHEVQKGETLFSISKKYGKSVEQLKQLNQLQDYGLKVGQKLIINENYKEIKPDVENTSYYHEVKKGETLYSIAKKYNMTVDDLKKLNKLENDNLSPGMNLLVSKAVKAEQKETVMNTKETFHTVAKGETLYAIAKKYNTTVDELKRLNNLQDGNLKIGEKLRIK